MKKMYFIIIYVLLLSLGAINSANQSITKLEAYTIVTNQLPFPRYPSRHRSRYPA